MNDSDAVLAANLQFYHAFTTQDVDAMDRLWARHAPVVCVHPGWPPLAEQRGGDGKLARHFVQPRRSARRLL